MELPPLNTVSWWNAAWYVVWGVLAFIGSGVSVCISLSRGEKVNGWGVSAGLISAVVLGCTVTKPLTDFAHLEATWSFPIAFIVGLGALGLVTDIVDRKVKRINKIMGWEDADDKSRAQKSTI